MQCFQNTLAYFAKALSLPCKMHVNLLPVACIIKIFTIVNDNSRVVGMTIVSDALRCITFDNHCDNSKMCD
jgi:hypothetical protein